jgi:ferritin-like metal-binding protein YciE
LEIRYRLPERGWDVPVPWKPTAASRVVVDAPYEEIRPMPTPASSKSATTTRGSDMKNEDLGKLFLETLKDTFYAEKQILKALPKMAKSATSKELRKAFETHRDETEVHVERLQQVFEDFGKRPQGKTCEAILGLIEEGQGVMEDFRGSDALDAGLLASAQAVEHYEISRYGTLKAWAMELGLSDSAKLLEQTLAEEKRTDELLTSIAENGVNEEGKGKASARH